jgi:hypothetical protein
MLYCSHCSDNIAALVSIINSGGEKLTSQHGASGSVPSDIMCCGWMKWHWSRFTCEIRRFSSSIIIKLLLHTHLSPLPELCLEVTVFISYPMVTAWSLSHILLTVGG